MAVQSDGAQFSSSLLTTPTPCIHILRETLVENIADLEHIAWCELTFGSSILGKKRKKYMVDGALI